MRQKFGLTYRMPLFYFILVVHYISLLVFAKVVLDKDHLEEYPNCGKMYGYSKPRATSRVVNSKDSKIQYPWVVLIVGRVLYVTKHNDGTKEESFSNTMCVGTVITNR